MFFVHSIKQKREGDPIYQMTLNLLKIAFGYEGFNILWFVIVVFHDHTHLLFLKQLYNGRQYITF